MLKILAPSADQLKSTRGFLDYLAKVCEANGGHFMSVSVHELDINDIPDYFQREAGLITGTNTAYKVAKSNEKSFNVSAFYE